MTMIDSPPATAQATAVSSPAAAGLYDFLATTDHKRIGRIWLTAGVFALIGAVVLGVLLGLERLDSGGLDIFAGENPHFQIWALYRFGLALLVVAPLFIGLATVIVPMQVGSTNIAFPRAALAAAWGFLIGAGILVVAVAAGGGWGAVDRATPRELDSIALTLVGMGLVVVSILLASLCLATTVVSLRVKGMTLLRTPLFAWSMLVTSAVWLLTLPILLANLAIAYVDLRGGPGTFTGGVDGSTAIFTQLEWLVEQPQVYSFAIPALGILGSIVAVSAGVRPSRHGLSLGLIGFFGLLSIGGWSQPFFQFDPGANVAYDEKFVFIAFGLLAIVPVLASFAPVADSLARGRDNLGGSPPAHLLGALAGALLLSVGAAAGVARVIEPFRLGGRITVSGVMNLVLLGAVVSAVAGIWFWSAKIGGRTLSPLMGRLAILDLVGGALLLGGAQAISGFLETSDDPRVPVVEDAADILSIVSLVGAVLVALGALGVLAAIVSALRSGRTTEADPWGGHTLEWATATPPPAGNFAEAPGLVMSEAPLLDAREQTSAEGEDS